LKLLNTTKTLRISYFSGGQLVRLAQKEWGHSAKPPAPLDVTPARPRAGYAPSTLLLSDTQRRSYTVIVWTYETFIVLETVIDRYLSVENLKWFKQSVNNNHDM
jgi:hypothetical protein